MGIAQEAYVSSKLRACFNVVLKHVDAKVISTIHVSVYKYIFYSSSCKGRKLIF